MTTHHDSVDPTSASFDPDAEALRLAMRVVAHARVARSFARIAAGVVQESAKQASTVLKAYAGAALATPPAQDAPAEAPQAVDAAALKRLARAAAEAATEVTATEIARVLTALDTITAPRAPTRDGDAEAVRAPAASPSGTVTKGAANDAA